MGVYEITTYPEMDRFNKENTRVGFFSDKELDLPTYHLDNIWMAELFQNNTTKEYSLLITTHEESWVVLKFETMKEE